MSATPRVLVSGYYGFGNAGDEAILAGLAEGFGEAAPGVELTVLSGDPAATELEHGVRAAPRGLASAYRLAREWDLLISGGGGLLQDVTSWRSPLYYLGLIRLAGAAGIPVACVGHGVGPLRRALIRSLTQRTLSEVGVLAVRDRVSERTLRELGVTRDVEVTADLAFLLPRPTEEAVELARGKAGLAWDERPRALLALRPPAVGACEGDLAPDLAGAIGGACDRVGLRPVLVAMQPARDSAFAERVAEGMSCEADVVAPGMSARELLALTAGCDLVIAMRLHALIFAAICGIPPVAISYDAKVDALMEQLGGEPATSTNRFDADALARAVCDAWEARMEVSADLHARARGLREAAQENVDLALGLLHDRGGGGPRH
ncbi:MAG: polysaccharide pyruvyl transferase CsaB [Armatimonadota bacterium]|nr:MAG: polysaccharide pyruvyl transferase CsaB [Armatimonadota bacterium]